MSTNHIRSNMKAKMQLLRATIDGAQAELEKIRDDKTLTDEGKAPKKAAVVSAVKANLATHSTQAQDLITSAQQTVEAKRAEVYAVSDADMQRAAITLSPVIGNAVTNPAGLLLAYQRRYQDLPSRILLEETIASTLDAMPEGINHLQLAEGFENARRELLPTRSDEQKAVDADIEAVNAAAEYARAHLAVAEVDTLKFEHGPNAWQVKPELSMQAANARFTIQQYDAQEGV